MTPDLNLDPPFDSSPEPGAGAGGPASPGAQVLSRNVRSRSVAVNVLAGSLSTLLLAAIGFVATPLILHGAGLIQYGLFALALNTVNYVGLLESGVGTATVTRVAAIERGGIAAINRVLSTSMALYAVIIAVVSAVLVALSLLSPDIFGLSTNLSGTARWTFLAMSLYQAANFASNVYTAGLFGTGRMVFNSSIGTVISTLVTVSQVVTVRLGAGSIGLALSIAGGALVSYVAQRAVLRHELPGLKLSFRDVSYASARHMFGLGLNNGVNFIARTIAYGSDLVVLGIILSPRDVAAYAIAQRPVILVRQVAGKISTMLTPTYASHEASGNRAQSATVFQGAIRWTLVLTLPATVVLIGLGRPLLHLWLGKVPTSTAQIMALLMLILSLQVPGATAFDFVTGRERGRQVRTYALVLMAVNLAASIVLTEYVGVRGPAYGSLVAVVLIETPLFPAFALRDIGASPRLLFANTRPLAVMVVVGAAVCYSVRQIPGATTAWPAVPAAAIVAIAMWGSWLLTAPANERAMLTRLARRSERNAHKDEPGTTTAAPE